MTARVVSARAASSAIICLGLLGCTGAKQEGFTKQGEEKATPAEDKAAPAKSPESEPAAAPKPSEPAGPHPGLADPAKATEQAPDTFHVKFTTTKGDFVVEASRAWAPNGADRLYNLVKIGYFKDVAFFRAIEGFMVQFGIHGDPALSAAWRSANIPDDPVKESNGKGYVTFATAGPNTRTTQLFINFGNNKNLDSMGFAPVGRVVHGMEVVESLYKGYGEGAPRGRGPDQSRIQSEGNAYLKRDFPNLDYIRSATIMKPDEMPKATAPHPALKDPSKATEKAPDTFKVKFTTTKGDFVVEANRAWAPNGADRLYNLVKVGYFKDLAFFRAIQGFMVQFGIHGDPAVSAAWRRANIQDDPVKESNAKGYVTFATAGPNTRTTQLFINYADNRNLDSMGFSPVGKVVQGMEVVESLHKGYGEGAPRGRGPDQGRVQGEGNAYLKRDFPNLDYIQSATIVE